MYAGKISLVKITENILKHSFLKCINDIVLIQTYPRIFYCNQVIAGSTFVAILRVLTSMVPEVPVRFDAIFFFCGNVASPHHHLIECSLGCMLLFF